MAAVHCAHHGRGQRRDGDRHAEPEDDHGGEKRRPVRAADARPRVQADAERRDHRAHRQRSSTAEARDKTARPSGQRKQHDRQRQQCGSSRRGAVALHLNEVHRQEKQDHAERRI